MPEVGQHEIEVLRLYSRCKMFNALPFAGGVLDQPIEVLELMDTVGGAIEEVQAKKDEEARTEAMKSRMLEASRG